MSICRTFRMAEAIWPRGHAPMAHGTTGHGAASHAGRQAPVSPFNFITLTAFLAWFGGTGFLITRFSSIWFALGLLIAMASRNLRRRHRVSVHDAGVDFAARRTWIPPTTKWSACWDESRCPSVKTAPAKLIYSQAGTRRACGARSDNGSAIEKGEEVVVARYEKGIAYVKRWEEISGEE